MIEFDVDMSYLLECDELDKVILNDESGEHEPMEFVPKDDATVDKDIEHYDGSARRGTVAILQGGRKPEEVLFVGDEGGVTHYLPEDVTVGTCKFKPVEILSPKLRGRGNMLECTRCGYQYLQGFSSHERPEYCPNCGRRIKANKK